MGKRKYVTDDYVEKINHYVYNDLSLRDLYVSEIVEEFNPELIKEILKEGEEYVRLENELEHVVVTNLGRAINTTKPNQYQARFTSNDLHIYAQRLKIPIQEIFEDNGWEFNVQNILDNFKRFNWKHKVWS